MAAPDDANDPREQSEWLRVALASIGGVVQECL